MKTENYNLILLGVLILIILFLGFKINQNQKESSNTIKDLRKSIIALDSLQKEADGRYSKLVNYYASEKELLNDLKNSNSELFKQIKKQDERILSLTKVVISLESKISEGIGSINEKDTNLIDLKLVYPDSSKPFITWDGYVNRLDSRYKGSWNFGKMPIQIVLTEESRGLWKTRFIGPEWFIVDSLEVKSLPPDEYTENVERKIRFALGGIYYRPLNNSNWGKIGVNAGVQILNTHSILISATSNQEVGLGYLHTFKSIKSRK
jgi:hypothetical protein